MLLGRLNFRDWLGSRAKGNGVGEAAATAKAADELMGQAGAGEQKDGPGGNKPNGGATGEL